MKAATDAAISGSILGNISIHAAREGGDQFGMELCCHSIISIHAAREGGDAGSSLPDRLTIISIHAAREGGDFDSFIFYLTESNFNPRRP